MEHGNSSSCHKTKATKNRSLPPVAPSGGTSSAGSNRAKATPGRRGLPPTPPPRSLSSTSNQSVPMANVVRVMRKALPAHAKISDDAKSFVRDSVNEFVSFITEEANRRCHEEQRKTVTAEDLISSMGRLGLNNYVESLTLYVEKYRELEGVNPRSQAIFRPSPARATHTGAHMVRPQFMMPPTMPPMNPNNNNNAAGIFATTPGQEPQKNPNYEPGDSSSLPIRVGEGSCSSIIDRINFDVDDCASAHDEVEFDHIDKPPADGSSPSGYTSANY